VTEDIEEVDAPAEEQDIDSIEAETTQPQGDEVPVTVWAPEPVADADEVM
jgi:hypothetical protein